MQRQTKRAAAPARPATPTTRDARLAAQLAALDPDDPRRVPCPSCGANAGAYCRRPSGHSGPLIQPHAARRAQLTGKAVPFPRPIATPFPPSVPERSDARRTTCERVKSPLPVPEPSPVPTARNANGWDDPAIRARRVAHAGEFYVYRYPIPVTDPEANRPRVDEFEVRVVESMADLDALRAAAFEDPCCKVRSVPRRLNAGAVAVCGFASRRLADIA